MEKHKKMAAAMAAVAALIRDEEVLALRRLGASPQRPAGVAERNVWGVAGRLDQMQKNQRIQGKP
ncbi:hypothetical protein LJC24_04960 [Desulfococcaceae bacterium OttesenSCG-928-F15]|nr:hypothetical protein [Desulfococcaceae bacterium OttesenSCG-928-F15]